MTEQCFVLSFVFTVRFLFASSFPFTIIPIDFPHLRSNEQDDNTNSKSQSRSNVFVYYNGKFARFDRGSDMKQFCEQKRGNIGDIRSGILLLMRDILQCNYRYCR